MRYYPAFLDIKGKRCVVVGGGAVAARKARALVRAGALVRVVAPQLGREMKRLDGLECRPARYSARELKGAWLVIAATDDPRVQQAVARDAARRSLLCNVVDSASDSNFVVPATFCRDELQLAISTAGGSPALARRLRRQLEKTIGPEYAALLKLLRELRPRVIAEVAAGRRRRVFAKMLESRALELLRAGRRREARRLLESLIEPQRTQRNAEEKH